MLAHIASIPLPQSSQRIPVRVLEACLYVAFGSYGKQQRFVAIRINLSDDMSDESSLLFVCGAPERAF